jgi:hypothetical protein
MVGFKHMILFYYGRIAIVVVNQNMRLLWITSLSLDYPLLALTMIEIVVVVAWIH